MEAFGVLSIILNHWDTIGLILTNIVAIFVPSPQQRKIINSLKGDL